MNDRMIRTLALTLLVSGAVGTTSRSWGDVIDFEDLPSMETYFNALPNPDTIVTGGVTINLEFLELSTTITSPAGSVHVDPQAGFGAGQGLDIRSVLLNFDLSTAQGISLLYRDEDRVKNLMVNGAFLIHTGGLFELDGAMLGGSTIAVTDDTPTSYGVFAVSGPITSFAIGGQDLVLNDITIPVPEPVSLLLAAGTVGVLCTWQHRGRYRLAPFRRP